MELKHSGLGIASFILSIIAGIFIFIIMIIAGAMEASTPGGIDEESVEAVLVGLFLFAFMFLSLVALGLGIFGAVQAERKKVFAIIGIVFSSITLLGIVFIMILGSAIG